MRIVRMSNDRHISGFVIDFVNRKNLAIGLICKGYKSSPLKLKRWKEYIVGRLYVSTHC